MPQQNKDRPGYKKTKIGWIPQDWPCVPFTSAFNRVAVQLVPDANGMYREIGVRSHGKGIFHKPPVSGKTIGNKRVFHCQPGALVFNIVFAWEQAVAVISEKERGMIASHRFPMYRGLEDHAFEPFYLLFFKTRRGKYALNIASPGGAGRNKTLGQKELEAVLVPKPSVEEQRAIAEVLECWDKAIRGYERKVEKKRKIKKGLMQRLLSGKQRLPGFEGEWKDVRLGDVFTFVKTYAFSRECLTTEAAQVQSIYNIHYGDIHATYQGCVLDLRQERRVPVLKKGVELPQSFALLRDGDLIMVDASEDYEGVGTCIELKNLDDRRVTGGLHTFVLRDSSGMTAAGFRGYMFSEYSLAKELKRIAVGISVYSISRTTLAKVSVTLPDLEEQKAIAVVLSAADSEVTALEQKLALLKDQKRFLLNNLVTGALRLPGFGNGVTGARKEVGDGASV